jgi:hypothetical protein
MMGGQQSARSLQHFSELVRHADKAGPLHGLDLLAHDSGIGLRRM